MSETGFYCESISGILNKKAPTLSAFYCDAGVLHPSSLQEAIFDLASLTKVICTGSILCEMASQTSWAKLMSLEVSSVLTELRNTSLEDVNVGDLLEHRSGLIPTLDLSLHRQKFSGTPQERTQILLQQILSQKRVPSSESAYSDIGFLLLGIFMERQWGQSLDVIWQNWQNKYQFKSSNFYWGHPQALPSEQRHPAGAVNDDKAFWLGGVAPHSGLFSKIMAVWDWMELIDRLSRQLPAYQEWTQLDPKHSHRFYKGWDTPSRGVSGSQAGDFSPVGTIGHLGFTGTALWWSPATGQAASLLSHRVFPAHSPQNQQLIKTLRNRFFDSFWLDKPLI